MDPFEDKYPFLSPYSYAACNPISVIDYNGDSIWINDNGNNILYSVGMKYTGKNKSVGFVINELNLLDKNSAGAKVLNSLIESKGNYNTLFDNNLPTAGQFVGDGTLVGGTITLNSGSLSFEALAHEVFHSYQQENGSGGPSQMIEAEAYLFSGAMALSLTGKNPFVGTGWYAGANYINDVSSLLKNYSDITFWDMVRDFPSGSFHNIDNIYSKLPYYLQNQKVLIHNIYPLLRKR